MVVAAAGGTDMLARLLAAMTVVVAGCTKQPDPIALIHYKQLGACTQAQTGNGLVVAPPSHAVAIFRVSSIDNTKTTKNWSFDSTALVVNPSSQMQQNLGGPGPVAIGAGQNVSVNVPVGILLETSNADGSDAATTNYFLVYPLAQPAPGALSVKDNPSQTQYPFAKDCNAIAGG
jgi:hypothetical protein